MTEAIVFGDVDNDGLRWPVETFHVGATPGRRLFELSRQPLQAIESVEVDGVALGPDEYTFDLVHGWVSVGVDASSTVTVRYAYSLKPDVAVTNWENDYGNQLYYNLNDAPMFGDFDDDGEVDQDDLPSFEGCFTGPGGGPIGGGCDAGDSDLDDDVDCDDFERFADVWTGPGSSPLIPPCAAAVPTVSEWGLAIMLVLVLAAGSVAFRTGRSLRNC